MTISTLEQKEKIRETFRKANVIIMLEGWKPDPSALERQEHVIRGEITYRELVDKLVRAKAMSLAAKLASARGYIT